MNAGLLTLFLGLGAGAIALWIDVRFPKLGPDDLMKSMFHVAASLAITYAAAPVIQLVSAGDDGRVALLVAFGHGFPSSVDCLLAGVWMINVTQRILERLAVDAPGSAGPTFVASRTIGPNEGAFGRCLCR